MSRSIYDALKAAAEKDKKKKTSLEDLLVKDIETLRENLRQTEEALLDTTDMVEASRAILRSQITEWRSLPYRRSWKWIKKQKTWEAFTKLNGI